MNTEANRVLVGRTFEALHDQDIHWGSLRSSTDFRHAIIDVNAPGLSKEDLLNGKAPCYIVGFSQAQANHECRRRVPILPLGSYLSIKEVGCKEIADVSLLLKFMEKSVRTPCSISASEALEWYAQYSARYPDQDNMDVTIAQRARLYPEAPPVYPQLHVSFEGDGEYPKELIFRNTDSDEETELTVASIRSDTMSPDPLATVVNKLVHTISPVLPS
ncbi:hypothetical protein B0H19DRAFT_1059636 [Mycena capillaripes]|nr:hypothetical protein B0H19DRAFT_1059636 [Mycena capillaripes]